MYTVYLTVEIHSNWREKIITGSQVQIVEILKHLVR